MKTNEMVKTPLKQKIILGALQAIIYGAILTIFYKVFYPEDFNLTTIALQALIFGVLMAFASPYASKKLLTKLSGPLSKSIKATIPPGETVLHEEGANLFRGIEGVGGKVFLTAKHLIFASHKFNVQSGQTNIPLNTITKVEKVTTGKIVDNGIKITTNNGSTYQFVINNRNHWYNLLTA